MEIIEDIRPQFLEATNLKPDDIIFMWTIKKINKRGKCKKRTLVITSNCLYVVDKRPLRRGLKVSRRYGYESIRKINKDDKGQIIIKNKEQHDLMFLEVSPNSIVYPMLEHILTIFTKEELPKLEILQKIPIEINPKSNPSFWRLKFKAYLHNKSQYINSDIRQIMNIMVTVETLDFSIFCQFPELFDEILDSLIVCPNIQKIIFHTYFPSWLAISEFFKVNKSVTSLETNQPIDNGFIQFARSISENAESKINSLSFSDNEFGTSFINILKMILQSKKIISLSIRNHLTKKGYQAIAPLILNFEGFQSVKYFDVSGCKFIEPEFVIIQLTNLTTLKINDCSIDISILLEDLSKNKNIPLTEIQCCDSFCSEKIDTSYTISKKIKSFVADNISWHGASLSKFLKILSKSENSNEIELSISYAQMSDPDWHSLDEFLQKFYSNTIVSLDYSGNRIQSGFCTFVNNSPKLIKLTVNGCFSHNENSIEIFSRYLSSNQNLEELHILGTDNHYLGTSVTYLFNALKMTHFLHVLDISYNKIGNLIFSFLFDLISSNPNLMDIYFDYNGISDSQALRQFYQKMTEINRKVNVHFPSSDISLMIENKLINESEIEEMKLKLFIIDDNATNSESNSGSNYRERKNSNRSKTVSIPSRHASLSASTSSAFQTYNPSTSLGRMQNSQPIRSPLGSFQMKRLNSLSSIDAFSQSISKTVSKTSDEPSTFNIRSISANSLNTLSGQNTGTSKNAPSSFNVNNLSDSSSKDHSSKKRKAKRTSDMMFAESQSNIPFDEQLKFERIRDEYISDEQWISFLNDIPSVDFEPISQSLEKKLSFYSLLQTLQPK